MIPRLFVACIAMHSVGATAFAMDTDLIGTVRPYVHRVEQSLSSFPSERKEVLNRVVDYVFSQVNAGSEAKLIFVCTHNSRRSHLAQVWCQVAATKFDVPLVETYSGGTEATACNIRTVRALRRAGLSVVASSQNTNPVYLIQYSDAHPPIRAFSKVYSASENPTSGFAAMMCCSDADKRCPVVVGADGRFALHYEDPKVADNTPDEAERYDERSYQIAGEMFYVMSEVSKRMNRSKRRD